MRKTTKRLLSLFGLATAIPLLAYASSGEPSHAVLSIGEQHTLASKRLNEDRPYQLYVPDECQEGGTGAPCPVLYMLDGAYHFHYASGMLGRMALNRQVPPMILVAVQNTADRKHDLTPTHTMVGIDGEEEPDNATSGGGVAFLDFLEKELIPEIESRYAVMPYRIFSGHSLGGLMALAAFVDRPGLFQAHIAVDPSLWWDDMELLKRAERSLQKQADIRNKVFITVAGHRPRGEEGYTIMETAGERFAYALEANPSPHLHSAFKQYPGEDHGSVALPSLYHGLRFVFEGYKNPPPAVAARGLEAVEAYYRDYLGPYGIKLTPPTSVLIDMASVALANGHSDKALDYHRYNLEFHPEDAAAHLIAAQAYREVGNNRLAVRHFKRSVELSPIFQSYVNAMLEATPVE